MQKVLVFAGVKQSHKSTSAKYVTASRMKKAGIIKFFEIDNDGDLIVSTNVQNPDGSFSEGKGILDLYRQDDEFADYAYERIWPLAKIYSFAEELKNTAVTVFGLNPKNVYGTDSDKEVLTQMKWGQIWHLLTKERQRDITDKVMKDWNLSDKKDVLDKYLSHRAFLQEFGSICRAFDIDCWAKACWRKIQLEGFPYCIIDDCRYENEVNVSNENGGEVILLTHQPFKDSHASEQIHSVDRKKFKYILDNANMTFDQKNEELEKILVQAGWTLGELS